MRRLFVIALATAVTLAASLGAFLFFSLWPFIDVIGRVTAGVVITGLVCVALFMISFTFNHIGIHIAKRKTAELHARVIIAGDVVAVPLLDGSFVHLSAMHEAAKVVQSVPVVKELPAPTYDNSDTVLELYDKGISLRTIADTTGMTYYQVQKITSEQRRRA